MAKSFLKWEYADQPNTIRVAGKPTPNPKKITGTRLGAICGVNHWKSDFDAWCEICRVAEEPFEDTKYTLAGKAIEPKLIEWCKENVSPNIVTPQEYFGTANVGYDFFPNEPVFGGMWDALVKLKGKPYAVIEAKTSSRPQDWQNGVPESYAVQGLAYAYLLGVDKAFFPVAFLEDEDYEHPETFECTDENTFLYELSCSDHLIDDLDISDWLALADQWWNNHVKTGISPVYDEKRDAKFLKLLGTATVTEHANLEALAREAAELEAEIATINAKSGVAALEKKLKGLKDQIKAEIIPQFGATDETVTAYGWQVKRSYTPKVNQDKLRDDGLWDDYVTLEESYRLTKTKEK